MSALFEKTARHFATRPLKQKIPAYSGKQKVIVISGPTGVGKTKISLVLAHALGGEVVSADSMQIYKGMDIGTAKPTVEQRTDTPHHLIDIRSLEEEFSVFDFYTEASSAIQDTLIRDKVPLVVGGTGFYLHALLYGPPTTPPSVPLVRARLEEEMRIKGSEALYAQLQALDPHYALTITQNDKHKIIRALEIMALTQNRVSQFSKESLAPSAHYDFRCWFLTLSMPELDKRIEKRCDDMLEQGFVDEVKRLDKEGLRHNLSASKAIGYRQCLAFLDSSQTSEDFNVFISAFKKASRRYARRQLTWFRKEPHFRWLQTDVLSQERIVDMIIQDWDMSN